MRGTVGASPRHCRFHRTRRPRLPACSQVTYYAQLSGQSREKVALDLDRDNFLSAQEALAYGLVDRIVE